MSFAAFLAAGAISAVVLLVHSKPSPRRTSSRGIDPRCPESLIAGLYDPWSGLLPQTFMVDDGSCDCAQCENDAKVTEAPWTADAAKCLDQFHMNVQSCKLFWMQWGKRPNDGSWGEMCWDCVVSSCACYTRNFTQPWIRAFVGEIAYDGVGDDMCLFTGGQPSEFCKGTISTSPTVTKTAATATATKSTSTTSTTIGTSSTTTMYGICLDTVGWANTIGKTCADYEAQYCENGGARLGKDFALGADWNYPENNCCACGKQTPPVGASTTKGSSPGACIDTVGWANPAGKTCVDYGTQYCQNGGARPGKAFALGERWNYPESNCCACGKQMLPPVGASTTMGSAPTICVNTVGWANPAGKTCMDYETQYCQDGGSRPGKSFALGESWNYPERNCCACGKQMPPGGTSTTTSLPQDKCIDTVGWANPVGKTCMDYETQYCQDGGSRPGKAFALGESWNYPERNCCACGKQTPPVGTSTTTSLSQGSCIDTEGWANPVGKTCNDYEAQYCQNGGPRPGKDFALGERWNYPENNCCSCGKKMPLGGVSTTMKLAVCADTAGWANPAGKTCADYEVEYCHNGVAKPGKGSALGAQFNYPESNCCACGKQIIVNSYTLSGPKGTVCAESQMISNVTECVDAAQYLGLRHGHGGANLTDSQLEPPGCFYDGHTLHWNDHFGYWTSGADFGKYQGVCTTRLSPVPPSTTIAFRYQRGWEFIGSLLNTSCRGDGYDDNSSEHYDVYSGVESLEACQAKCLESGLSYCKGVEYSVNHCEIWHREEGIWAFARASMSGSTCLRFGWLVSYLIPVDGGVDRACQGESVGDRTTESYIVKEVSHMEDCKARCAAAPICFGVEYSQPSARLCAIWVQPVRGSTHAFGSQCLRYEPPLV